MDNTPQQSEQPTIFVIVRNRERVVIQKNVKSVTANNDKGTFDILPQHANFITLIQKSITIIDTEGKKEEIKTKNGVLKVSGNEVYIYIGI